MGKGSGSAPKAPDPTVVANAQASANRDTAIAQTRLNQVNEITPYGSATYSPTGQTADGIAQYQLTTTLSPAQQAILNSQNATTQQAYNIGQQQLTNIGNTLAQPLDYSSLPPAPTMDDAYRTQVQNALYNRATSSLDPTYANQQRQLETQLVNEGFARGGEAYNRSLDQFDQQRNTAYENAANDAVANSGNAAAQQFGLQSQARQQALQEQLSARDQPINELATLLGTSSGVQTPQFSAPPQTQIAPTDVTGPTYSSYNANLNQYNQQQSQNNSFLGSLFGVAGDALGGWLGGSDPASKTDVGPTDHAAVLDGVRSMDVPTWHYKGDTQVRSGPMADEWADHFGGDAHVIPMPQAFGISLSAIKALADEVDKLKARRTA